MDEEQFQEIKSELQEVVDSRSDEMFESYIEVRDILQTAYEWPEVDVLRHEVCLCLIFGLYQAGMTMTNHMLESFLKTSLGYKESFDNFEPENEDKSTEALVQSLKPGFEKYDDKSLYQTIEAAYKKDLISEDQKDRLHEFRDDYRNAYSHAQKAKIHKDREIPIQSVQLDEESKEFEVEPETEQKIVDLPFIHGQAQYYHAKAHAPAYFRYVNDLVWQVKEKLFPSDKSDAV